MIGDIIGLVIAQCSVATPEVMQRIQFLELLGTFANFLNRNTVCLIAFRQKILDILNEF